MLGFEELQDRLVENLLARVRAGEFTERSLARITGISQPHMHNVLMRKRGFSLHAADEVLLRLQMDVLDLLAPSDVDRVSTGR
jgi:glycine/serine hydroxymethyltransferase